MPLEQRDLRGIVETAVVAARLGGQHAMEQMSYVKAVKKNENELDVLIEEWTTSRSAEEVMHIMQEAGISAGVVLNGRAMREDPQFNYRHYFWELEHPEMGLTAYDGTAFKLSQTPSEIRMPAPCLGEHTEYVCCHLLGMTDEEFTELLDAGVFN